MAKIAAIGHFLTAEISIYSTSEDFEKNQIWKREKIKNQNSTLVKGEKIKNQNQSSSKNTILLLKIADLKTREEISYLKMREGKCHKNK